MKRSPPFKKVAGERQEEKKKWGMNVQNATPLGVKLYIITQIVIFKKPGEEA